MNQTLSECLGINIEDAVKVYEYIRSIIETSVSYSAAIKAVEDLMNYNYIKLILASYVVFSISRESGLLPDGDETAAWPDKFILQ